MIACLTPSRGMIFTEIAEYVETLRKKYPLSIKSYYTHNLPIPDCFNSLVEQALADNNEFLFFIEEDTIPPAGVFEEMIGALKEGDIACVDYGFNGGFNTIVKNAQGEIMFSGFGCTMVKRHVFEELGKPYFRADKAFNLSNQSWYNTDPNNVYGMFDVEFGYRAREHGFKFVEIPGECRHLQLIELGKKETNNGCHTITEKDKISKKIVI